MELKDKIKNKRIEEGLTQDELAEKLNVTRQTISKYELGINVPDVFTLKEIAKALNTTVSYLLDEEIAIKEEKDKKYKASKVIYLVNVGLCIFTFFSIFVLLRFMNDTIPLHYDINFNVNRYGSKYEMILVGLIQFLPLIMATIFRFINEDTLKAYRLTSGILLGLEIMFLCISLVFSALIFVFSFMVIENLTEVAFNILIALFSLLFMVISIFVSSLFNKKVNPYFGYRTRYSLKNDRNWKILNNTQCVSGFIFSGIALALSLIYIGFNSVYFFFVILSSILVTFGVEIYLRCQDKKQ